jgi:putative transposase
MPWKETCAMDEKKAFVLAWRSGEFAMSELCHRFAISRPTGYGLLERAEQEGWRGLEERSRAPQHHPNATAGAQVAAILACKRRHPSWGPVTVRAWLQRECPQESWPASSTTGDILKRHGLVHQRRRGHRSVPAHLQPFVPVEQPNDVWSADFKGQFRLGEGGWCYPLTVTDNYSRMLLCCRGLERPQGLPTRRWMERTFREYGLPRALRTDNGTPFASPALGGLSALAVWLLKLGVMPERIAPGQPQQNGRHERMHRTLKAATASPPQATLRAQQRAFAHFQREFNEERPHRALAGHAPAQYHRPSLRHFPNRMPELAYPDGFVLRKVRVEGHMKWQGHEVFVSKLLAGHAVGLMPLEHDRWEIYFGLLPLGVLDGRTHKILRPDPKV